MKNVILGVFLFTATALITSCSNDNDGANPLPEGIAAITVSLKSTPASRYVGPSSPNPAVESVVSNFTVFVYNYITGELERKQSFYDLTESGDVTRQITGLSTGTEKRIVAFVNVPGDVNLDNFGTYSSLNANVISLDSQNSDTLATAGLFMSGQTTTPIRLAPSGTNTVEVPVRRRVAKVVLTNLTIDPEAADLIPNFTLAGVSIQRARLTGTPVDTIVNPTGAPGANYAGGVASPSNADPNFSLTRTYLNEALTLPGGYTAGTNIITDQSLQRYFYVLPNNGYNNNPTLLTIYGTYGTTATEPAYYPIEINSTTGQGNTDGRYIEGNKVYSLSVTIRRLGDYSEDPNVVPVETAVSVTIEPQDWDLRINQPVEW